MPPRPVMDALHSKGWYGRQFAYGQCIENVVQQHAASAPALTVIMEVSNPARELIPAVHRLMTNVRCPVELVVVDNHCSAPHKTFLLDVAHTIVTLSCEVQRPQALNIGTLFASAPLLLFLSDRCCPAADIGEQYLACMQSESIVAGRGTLLGVEDPAGSVLSRSSIPGGEHVTPIDLIENMCVRAPVFYKANGFNEAAPLGSAALELSISLLAHYPPQAQWYCSKAVVTPGSTFDLAEYYSEGCISWSYFQKTYARETLGLCVFWCEQYLGKQEAAS